MIVTPPRIILLNNSMMYFQAIQDRIEYEKLTKDILYLQYPDEALAAIPTEGSCIIIMDSLLVNTFKGEECENLDQGARLFARKCKRKNPKCRSILYTVEPFDLKAEEFDCFIHGLKKDSYEDLFKKLKEYCKN